MGKINHQHESASVMLFPLGRWEIQEKGEQGGGKGVLCLVPTQ